MNDRIIATMVALAGLAGCQSTPDAGIAVSGRVKSFDGVELAYDVRGRSELPAVIFIHGWCCNRGQWASQVESFAKDRRVVAIDLAGHGESEDNREQWTLESFARDVESVVHHLELERVILVGHSMGGPVSLFAARRMPDRVIGVIGVDTLHNAEMRFSKEMVDQLSNSFERDFEGTMRSFIEMMYPPQRNVPRDMIDRVLRDALDNEPRMAIGVLQSFGDLDAATALAECPAPVRCINAAVPHPTRVDINRMHHPRFNVVLMEGAGHWPHVEQPVEFNTLLRGQLAALRLQSQGGTDSTP